MQNELIELLPSLRRYAYSLTGKADEADDLLQSSVEKILAKGVPDDVNLSAWAFRVCRNLWIDQYRARKTREQYHHDPVAVSESVETAQTLEAKLHLQEVEKAMDTLSDAQRELIGLVAVEGWSYKKIASTFDLPMGTVMSRIARARSALTQALKLN